MNPPAGPAIPPPVLAGAIASGAAAEGPPTVETLLGEVDFLALGSTTPVRNEGPLLEAAGAAAEGPAVGVVVFLGAGFSVAPNIAAACAAEVGPPPVDAAAGLGLAFCWGGGGGGVLLTGVAGENGDAVFGMGAGVLEGATGLLGAVPPPRETCCSSFVTRPSN